MSRINIYLQYVSLPTIIALLTAIFLIGFVVPRRRIWQLAVVISPTWMLMSRMVDFPYLSVYAKILTFIPSLMLIIGVLLVGRFKFPTPPVFYFFIIAGLMWIVCVSRCDDNYYAMFIRFQWIIMCCGALMLAKLILHPEYLGDFLKSLFVGSLIAVAVMGSGLLFDGNVMDLSGHTRFSPWGTNPNQINLTLALAYAISIYFITNKVNLPLTIASLALIIPTALMVLLTLSRSTVLMAGIVTVFMFGNILRKRPILSVLVGVIIFAASMQYLTSESIGIDRLKSLDTGRGEIALAYFDEIMDRPLLGLMTTSGKNSWVTSIGAHPHNVLILAAYVGGFPLAILFLIPWSVGVIAMTQLYLSRERFAHLAPVITCFLALYMTYSAATAINIALIWPTYFESQLIVVICLYAMMLKKYAT